MIGQGHMTKIAVTPVFSGTRSPMILKLGMQHRGLEVYKVHINDDPGMTTTFYAKVKFGRRLNEKKNNKTVTKPFKGKTCKNNKIIKILLFLRPQLRS